MPRKLSTKSRPKNVRFSIHDPEAQSVSLAGSFNEWDVNSLPMERDSKGTWKASLSLQPGRYEYRFCVDGTWQEDPKASERVDNPFGTQNCVRIVT